MRNKLSATNTLCINKFFKLLFILFQFRIDKSTYLLTICEACSDLDKWILQEWINLEQFYNYGSPFFHPHSTMRKIILVVMGINMVGNLENFVLDFF